MAQGIAEYVDEYTKYLLRRNRSRATADHYSFVIRRCMEMLAEGGLRYDPEDIGDEEISYLMDNLGVRESTMKNFINIFGGMVEHFTGRNPVKTMGILWNRERAKRKFIDGKDLGKLMELAQPTDRLILVLGAFMGLRRKEMAEITLDDIGEKRIKVKGKGHGRDGLVADQPAPEIVRQEIARYLEWREKMGFGDERYLLVIPYKDGYITCSGHLTSITNRVARLGKRVGVDLSCHSLRRLYCTTLAENGCPLGTIRELMRHSDINTTLDCYIRPSGLHLDEWAEMGSKDLSESISRPKRRGGRSMVSKKSVRKMTMDDDSKARKGICST